MGEPSSENSRSRRVVEALGLFGLWRDPGQVLQNQASNLGVIVRAQTPVVLITGPSGSGKSTVLSQLRKELAQRSPVIEADRVEIPGDRVVAELSDEPLELWLRTLSRAGLGEARLLGRTPSQLSVGELHRLRVALAMSRAMLEPGTTVLVDEFVSPLDRATAEAVSFSVHRWAQKVWAKSGVRLVVASAHEDLESFLHPGLVVRCEPLHEDPRIEHRKSLGGAEGPLVERARIRIERGTLADYEPMSRFHYLAGPPATVAGVWRAVRTTAHGERVAGVLIASYPTLNGRWRQRVWPGRYTGKSSAEKRTAAKRLNRELRCLSRVVVEPASRGLGVARELVEHYLSNALTGRTEAVAAMGSMSPFFARAGMAPTPLRPRVVDERLRRVLGAHGIEPLDVLTGKPPAGSTLERALTVWVNATAEVKRARAGGALPEELWNAAACRLIAKPIAYTAMKN